MKRLINVHRAVTWAMHKASEADIVEAKELAIDTLLFDLALKGRVPACAPSYYREHDNHCVSVMGYYVGRAKAMKAYKTDTTKDYYVTAAPRFGSEAYKLNP